MNINELKEYYNQQEAAYKTYLNEQLSCFKDANNKYLDKFFLDVCLKAESEMVTANKKALYSFYEVMTELEQKFKDNYPPTLLNRMAESAKRTLEGAIKFNQSIFDQSISYYKGLLKK